jgi:hypothetical protein
VADWKALEIQVPGKDLVEPVRGVLETLGVFLELLKTLLQTIELFLVDFGNPIRALVNVLLGLIKDLFASLKQTGLYFYADVPDPRDDPNFHRFAGGYQAFTQRFIGSLFDSRDPFRPQPVPGVSKSGFLLIVADAESVFGMLRLLKILLRFFGREFTSPQYRPPANVKVQLAGNVSSTASEAVDPILQIRAAFGSPLKGLVVEWGRPGNVASPDPGFGSLVRQTGAEFIPPKFLIEKTSRPGGPEVLVKETTTTFEDRRGRNVKRKVRVRDEYGDLFRTFERYYVLDTLTDVRLGFGQRGTFRFVDQEVDPDKTYSYRIRAFSGSLDVRPDGTLPLGEPEREPSNGEFVLRWPASDPSDPPVLGRPSAIFTGRVPTIPKNFNVLDALENLFLVAFSLGFHLPLDAGATFDPQTGLPTESTSPIQVGRGSLTDVGGILSSLIPDPPPLANVQALADPVDGTFPDVYWSEPLVRIQARRLAQAVGGAFLEQSSMLEPFRALMQGPLRQAIAPPSGTYLDGVTTPETLLANFLTLPAGFPKTYDSKVYATYQFGFFDPALRLDVLAVVRFVKSFTLGGTPPDWQSVSLLRDIVPWTGQLLYEMLARIDALAAAFKSISAEMEAYIDALVAKIEALERFLEFLIQILNFLDAFEAGFYLLKVPSVDGGIPEWIDQIQNAGGDKPASGPGGYTGGVALAWSAPDIAPFAKAIDILF